MRRKTGDDGPDKVGGRLGWGVLLMFSVLLALGLDSCSVVRRTRSMFGGKLQVEVDVRPGANLNSPIAVELVVINDRKVLDKVQMLPAREWFQGREQFLRDNPKVAGACTWEQSRPCLWEWVPGQGKLELTLDVKAGAQWGVLFADYLTAGDHRLLVDPRKHFQVELGAEAFTVTPPGGGG